MVAFLEVGFFPRIHTAIAEWLACMLFILPQKKRFGESSWQQIGCCIGFLALLLGLNLLNQQQSGLTWMLLMAACMGTMLAMIVCCCKLKLMKAGYIWAHAFITAEFAASLEWQINYYLLMAGHLAGDGGDVHHRVFRDLPAEPEASYPAQWHKRHAAGAYQRQRDCPCGVLPE